MSLEGRSYGCTVVAVFFLCNFDTSCGLQCYRQVRCLRYLHAMLGVASTLGGTTTLDAAATLGVATMPTSLVAAVLIILPLRCYSR